MPSLLRDAVSVVIAHGLRAGVDSALEFLQYNE